MAKMVRFSAPHESVVVDEDERPLRPDEVRVRTLFSGISAGTELTAYRGSNPYLTKRWDEDRRLFVDGSVSFEYPVDGWGYEEVGEISELGSEATGVELGQRVWGCWGHRGSNIQKAERARDRILPADADPVLGIFSQIGAIALNVILDADIHLGETVAVFGLGVPGQIVAQMARANGARVIGVDGIAARREKAIELGADEVIDASAGQVAEQIRVLTGGRGADVCLEISGHYAALEEAIRSVAYSSRVVAAGFFQGGGEPLRLGEEFHHNRISVICSQISGVAPALQHRWNEYRLATTAVELATEGRIDFKGLISHEYPIDRAPEAFELLDHRPSETLQVVLSF